MILTKGLTLVDDCLAMVTESKIFMKVWVALLGAMMLFSSAAHARTSEIPEAISRLAVDDIHTMDDMAAAVRQLKQAAQKAGETRRFSHGFQEQVLTKTGACISRLVTLQAAMPGQPVKKTAGDLLAHLREIIEAIAERNKNTISDLQEHHLDDMKDPMAFFHSDAWQKPHYLVSLSSYWLGWNGYYAGMLSAENESEKTKLWMGAIDSFSRTFIEFEEDAIVARSLFGRALCYKALNAYDRAVHDLKSAMDKIGRTDALFFRCLVERAILSHESGRPAEALRMLDSLHEEHSRIKIPGAILEQGNRLRAKILLGRLVTQPSGDPAGNGVVDKQFKEDVEQLRNLAVRSDVLAAEFYRYVQSNTQALKTFSFAELGPIGAAAMADFLFDNRQFTEALEYYLHLDAAASPNGPRDNIRFRLAYIYCKQEQWHAALGILENFSTAFPGSGNMLQAIRLYYVAATHVYRSHADDKTYARYVEAVKCYLEKCGGCPDQSEARFQMGQYYQKTGNPEKAMGEYARVGEDSPHFGLAKYHLLRHRVDQLDDPTQQGLPGKADIYADGLRHVIAYHAGRRNKADTALPPAQAAHWVVLQARLYGYGPEAALKQSLKQLEGFEQRFPSEKNLGMIAARQRIACYQKLAMFQEARNEIDRLLAADPMDSQRYVFLKALANRFYKESKSSGSAEDRQRVTHFASASLDIYRALYPVTRENSTDTPDGDAMLLRMGEIYLCQNNLAQARDIYLEMLRRNPHCADAVYQLATIHEQTGQWEQALAGWRRFSDGTPDGTVHWYESRYRTARALMKLGQDDKACTIVTMTTVLHPDMCTDLVRKFRQLQSEVCRD